MKLFHFLAFWYDTNRKLRDARLEPMTLGEAYDLYQLKLVFNRIVADMPQSELKSDDI